MARIVSIAATATNAIATATIAGRVGYTHILMGLTISASAQPVAAVQATITSAATVKKYVEVPANAFSPIRINYPFGVAMVQGEALTLTLPALGAGVTGSIDIDYATEKGA